METWLHPREGNAWDIHVGEQPKDIKFSKKNFLGWYFSYQTQAQTKQAQKLVQVDALETLCNTL